MVCMLQLMWRERVIIQLNMDRLKKYSRNPITVQELYLAGQDSISSTCSLVVMTRLIMMHTVVPRMLTLLAKTMLLYKQLMPGRMTYIRIVRLMQTILMLPRTR